MIAGRLERDGGTSCRGSYEDDFGGSGDDEVLEVDGGGAAVMVHTWR